MADKKISALTAATTPLVGTEVLPIVQSGATVKVANNDLRPKQIQSNATSGVLQVAGPTAAATRVMTTPDANFSVARIDASQTFVGTQIFNGVFYSSSSTGVPTAGGVNAYNTGGYASPSTGKLIIGDGTGWEYSFAKRSASVTSDLFVFADSGNATLSTGNLVIGTSGKGIDFSATPGTGTSELLADYEEGTWTPVVVAGSGTITTVGAVVGRYTKIGRIVTLYASIPITTNGTGATSINVSGLPFSISADLSIYSAFGVNSTTAKMVSGFISGASIFCRYYDATYPIASGETIFITVSYQA